MISHYLTPKIAHLMKVRNYPSVPLRDKMQLPRLSGVYYCLRGWQVLYIGKSTNMYQRWNSFQYGEHHKLEELMKIEETLGDIDIHYCLMPVWLIGFDEAIEINRFKPKLNKKIESIWDNLNLQVIRILAIKGFVEFLLLGCLGYFLVMLIDALS